MPDTERHSHVPDINMTNRLINWQHVQLGKVFAFVAGLILPVGLPLVLSVAVTPIAFAQEGSFTLNLKNADIHSLIQTVSRQSGRNFVVDPRVKARVTVISSTPLSSEELYETFLSVLQVHGYAAVPSGDLVKIVPDVNAK